MRSVEALPEELPDRKQDASRAELDLLARLADDNGMTATLRIVLAAPEGKRQRTLTVTMSALNTTTLPNKTQKYRQFVCDFLEPWKLLAQTPTDPEEFEVVA